MQCIIEKRANRAYVSLTNFPKIYSSDFKKEYEIVAIYLSISLSNIILNMISCFFLIHNSI